MYVCEHRFQARSSNDKSQTNVDEGGAEIVEEHVSETDWGTGDVVEGGLVR